VHSASHCCVEQISGKRGNGWVSADLHRNASRAVILSAIEGKQEFRFLRILFDASGKTVAVWRHAHSRAAPASRHRMGLGLTDVLVFCPTPPGASFRKYEKRPPAK
jgi:hypothetical protein